MRSVGPRRQVPLLASHSYIWHHSATRARPASDQQMQPPMPNGPSPPLGCGTVRAATAANRVGRQADPTSYLQRLRDLVRTASALIYLISKSNLASTIITTARPLVEQSPLCLPVCMAQCRSCPRDRTPPRVHLTSTSAPPAAELQCIPRAGLPFRVMMVRVHHNVAVHHATRASGITQCIPNNSSPTRET